MPPLNHIYNLLLNTAGRGLLPWLWSRTDEDPVFRRGRLGYYDGEPARAGQPRLWFHAASVGEVTGATAILAAIHERLPQAAICLTVGTRQGFRFARAQLPEWAQVLPFPLDFPKALERAYGYLQPDLYIALESEFWPNLFSLLRNRQVPALLLNGRLSSRSAQFYTLLKPLFQPIFAQFRWLAMHSEEDLRNILAVGADPQRGMVLGSAKYDGLLAKADPDKCGRWRDLLKISADLPVIIGGSLRGMECTELLRIFQTLARDRSDLVGIFVPRHLHQIQPMAHWLEQQGMPFQYLSQLERNGQPRSAPVVLVDRIGILFELYALGDLIFCGGTLEPIGGHNILEPAAWQKPVFYGPHLKKVSNEHKILQHFGGSFLARDGNELCRLWSRWLGDRNELQAHGRQARAALLRLGGVVDKQADLIMAALPQSVSAVPANRNGD